jgi:1,4-alpha-glucan branching enzyme
LADGQEWSEHRGLDWSLTAIEEHAGIQRLVADLNATYRGESALWSRDTSPEGFAWIVGDDAANNVFAYERIGAGGELLVCVVNFSALPHEDYRIGLSRGGRWLEILNTDATGYGGSGVGNFGEVDADDAPSHGRPASASLRIPPLGAIWLRPAA